MDTIENVCSNGVVLIRELKRKLCDFGPLDLENKEQMNLLNKYKQVLKMQEDLRESRYNKMIYSKLSSEEIDDCRLPRARRADDCHFLTFFGREIEVFEFKYLFAKSHIVVQRF